MYKSAKIRVGVNCHLPTNIYIYIYNIYIYISIYIIYISISIYIHKYIYNQKQKTFYPDKHFKNCLIQKFGELKEPLFFCTPFSLCKSPLQKT